MEFGSKEKLLLRILSDNSRASGASIAKGLHCSRTRVNKMIRTLTEELDIRFTLELDPEKLAPYSIWIMSAKFGSKPNESLLRNLLRDEWIVHNAYATEGQFDLVLFLVGQLVEVSRFETYLGERLSEYEPNVITSALTYQNFGFVPLVLDSSFFRRAGGALRLDQDDLKILQILSTNSRLSYVEVSARTGIAEDTVRYRFLKLSDMGIVRRGTIAVQKPPHAKRLVFFENWTYQSHFEERAKRDRESVIYADQDVPLLTTFQFFAPLLGGYQNVAMGLFRDEAESIQKAIHAHEDIYARDKVKISYAWITYSLKGLLPYRNVDPRDYQVVNWTWPK